MTKKDYSLIAGAIWRSGFFKNKNKIKQEASEKMRRLITSDLIGGLKANNPKFNEERFLEACNIKI